MKIKMSWLGILNRFVLQILFVRLCKSYKTYKELGLNPNYEYETDVTWSLMYFIVPFTGWGTDYKVVGKKKHFLKLIIVSQKIKPKLK